MIEAQSLTRYYGSTPAVSEVSFSIPDNAVVGLLGHNGAGKTTVMRMLAGCLEPHAGRVLVDGADLAGDPARVQAQLGYLPETLPVYPDMLVADYLEYAATVRGVPGARRMDSVAAALAATDLTARALDPVRTLSRGMRQRVGVAQAILDRPRLLILDEPTNGLDPRQTQDMRRLIRQLAQRATVILSTHIMQEVSAVCDRVLLLQGGRLALDARLDELAPAHALTLQTDGPRTALEAGLARLSGVSAITCEALAGEQCAWRLQLLEGAEVDTVAADAARCVVEAGAALHRLQPERPDLDSLFEVEPDDGD